MCAVSAGTLLGRMIYLSVVEGPGLVDDLAKFVCGDTVKMSYRGPILDRNGVALATSTESYQVALRRKEYNYDPGHAAKLARLLDRDQVSLDETLRSDPAKFIWLSRNLDVDAANALRRLAIRGIDVHRDQHRTYPQGPLAAHVVGFVGVDAQGLEGIERVFDKAIRGTPVSRRVCKDSRGRVFLSNAERAGVNRGATVELTLDATLQSIAESELNRQIEETRAVGGSVVILDPRSGEILAMANAPGFDPNYFARAPAANRRNRVVTDSFEPGSTLKPFLVAAALDVGAVSVEDTFYCENGSMRVGGWTIHDHHPHEYLTVPEIIKVSSNICSAKLGARLGVDLFHAYLTRFGFSRKPGSGLPGEVAGLLKPPSAWRAINLANISFGQGISVTALQLAKAFAVIANGGVDVRPSIVKRVTAPNGEILHSRTRGPQDRVVSAEVARQVGAMLEAVVAEGGTAPRARVEGIRVAGKTGTAQKAENGHYSKDRWLASFVGYLPADDPRMVIAVTVDEPHTNHFGGVVAAPVFRHIAEASLDYMRIHRAPTLITPVVALDVPSATAESTAVPTFDGTMPDLHGLSLRSAMRAVDGCDCMVSIDGSGYIVEQKPKPGAKLAASDAVVLRLASSASP